MTSIRLRAVVLFASLLGGCPVDPSSEADSGRPLPRFDAAGLEVGPCVGADQDGDGRDSIACGGDDCDDADPNRAPGRTEVCDAADHDEDCDPTTYGYRDLDRDDSPDAQCCNGAVCGEDCDDMRGGTHPGATEACNGRDDDCNGTIDDGVLVVACADCDGDGHGVPSTATASSCGRAPSMTGCSVPMGYATNCDDCDDGAVDVYGGRPEDCDGVDNDCNGMIDDGVVPRPWYVDCDGDGLAAGSAGAMTSCARPESPPSCSPGAACLPSLVPSWTPLEPTGAASSDCDDFHTAVHVGATEICDGLDTDCDPTTFGPGEDDDGDGFADRTCGACGTDCDDTRDFVYVGATEIVGDRIDENCDAMEICFVDADLDSYGTAAQTTTTDVACTAAMGHAARSGDCCDADDRVRPNQTTYFTTASACGYDYDCSGAAEPEGSSLHTCPTTCTGPCGGASFRVGWNRAIPACGESAEWITSCTSFSCPFSCQPLGDMRAQGCR